MLHEIGTRIGWAMPTASACLSQAERNAIASAEASIARLRNQLAALALQLGGWRIRPT